MVNSMPVSASKKSSRGRSSVADSQHLPARSSNRRASGSKKGTLYTPPMETTPAEQRLHRQSCGLGHGTPNAGLRCEKKRAIVQCPRFSSLISQEVCVSRLMADDVMLYSVMASSHAAGTLPAGTLAASMTSLTPGARLIRPHLPKTHRFETTRLSTLQ